MTYVVFEFQLWWQFIFNRTGSCRGYVCQSRGDSSVSRLQRSGESDFPGVSFLSSASWLPVNHCYGELCSFRFCSAVSLMLAGVNWCTFFVIECQTLIFLYPECWTFFERSKCLLLKSDAHYSRCYRIGQRKFFEVDGAFQAVMGIVGRKKFLVNLVRF